MTNSPKGGRFQVPKDIEPDKPQCPDHLEEMIYSFEEGVWHCPKYQCDRKARKRLSFEDAEGTVIGGSIYLYQVGEGKDVKYYLYLTQLKAFIDINLRIFKEITGPPHLEPEKFVVSMKFGEGIRKS